jgi:hypothetical protein
MGYKICTPGVQVFLGYEKAKWGIVPPNGVHMAALIPNPKRTCISPLLSYIILFSWTVLLNLQFVNKLLIRISI